MKEIELTQGKVALVDDDQYEFLNQWKWCAIKCGNSFYAARSARVKEYKKGKRYNIYMHHTITGYPSKGFETDHRNGQGLDNQRHNLRFVTRRQNQQNQRNNKKKSSKYPGVYWYKATKKWMARIGINGKGKYLGCFINELEAFAAYKQAVKNLDETIIGSD